MLEKLGGYDRNGWVVFTGICTLLMWFIISLLILLICAWNNRCNTFIYFLLCLYCILIIGFNYDNPDYSNYELMFDRAEYPYEFNILSVLDIGFKIIQAYFKSIGIIEYSEFRPILSLLIIIIFGTTIYRNCKYYNLCLIIFIIFYLALDQIQIRNFFAFVIILPFLLAFLKRRSLHNLIAYLCAILIAFTIHFSAIFFIIFSLIYIKKKSIRLIFLLISIVILGSLSYALSDLAMVARVENNYNKPSILGAIAGCAVLIFNYLYIKYLTTKTMPFNNTFAQNIYNNTFSKYYLDKTIILQINVLLMLFMPLLFINGTVMRLWRFISFVNVIYLLNILRLYKNNNRNNYLIYIIFYVGFVALWMNNHAGVFQSLFNNYLIK